MKISHLVKMEPEKITAFMHGIEIDEYVDTVIPGIKEIGIVAAKEGDSLSFDVIDTALMYVTSGVDVVLEIPFSIEFEPKAMIVTAMNCGIALSIMPPVDVITKDDWAKYGKKLSEYTYAWLNQSNAQTMLYPSVGFFQYMIGEVFGYKQEYITQDDYIQEQFVDNMPQDIMDEIKSELREVIYSAFEGKEKFEVFANSLGFATINRLKEIITQ